MKDRPAMETMVKRYEAMQADVFDSLEKEFGAKPGGSGRTAWAVDAPAAVAPRTTPRASRSSCRR